MYARGRVSMDVLTSLRIFQRGQKTADATAYVIARWHAISGDSRGTLAVKTGKKNGNN